MILDRINKPENSPKILALSVILLVFLYALLITPLLEKSEQIEADIISENELSLFLDTAQQKLSNLSQFPVLSKEQEKEQIRTTFLSQEVLLNSLDMNNQSSIAIINKISFALLLDILQQLKNQSGIIVTSAIIERIEPGLVTAQLTFSNSLK
jgi:type II secretory pathway component PulM